jgi:hypothetical protein
MGSDRWNNVYDADGNPRTASAATSDERCPRCDRANCKREERRQDHERLQSFNTEIEYQAEKAACDDEAVDWRARALDLQSQLAAAQVRVAEVEREVIKDSDGVPLYVKTIGGLRDDLVAEQAKSAAMREALGWLRGEIGVFIQHVGYLDAVDRALASDAGRPFLDALAAKDAEIAKWRDIYERDVTAEREALLAEKAAHEATKRDRDGAIATRNDAWERRKKAEARASTAERDLEAARGHATAMRDWCAAWLRRAVAALFREGWEEGMTERETIDALTDVLANLGCDDGTGEPAQVAEAARLDALPITHAPPTLVAAPGEPQPTRSKACCDHCNGNVSDHERGCPAAPPTSTAGEGGES